MQMWNIRSICVLTAAAEATHIKPAALVALALAVVVAAAAATATAVAASFTTAVASAETYLLEESGLYMTSSGKRGCWPCVRH